ncbi:MAG: hypothetical protein JXQ73_13140 [Phycisphaerae bacterium]|nr:hypothetical protein [Phycisphaerae bacterium]
MSDCCLANWNPFCFGKTCADSTSSASSALKTPALKTGSSSSSSSGAGDNPIAQAFTNILEEAITGLTAAAAQFASKRVAEFVEDRSRLQFIAQAAGWTSSSGSSSGSSGSSGSSSGGSDPISTLVTAVGETLLQALRDATATQNTTATDTTQTTDTTQNTTDAQTQDTTTQATAA